MIILKGFRAQSPIASDYLVTPDLKHHSTWSLPVSENGKPNHHLMGEAYAALHGGLHGNAYGGVHKELAVAKLRRLYKQEKMEWPTVEKSDFDSDNIPVGEHPADCKCQSSGTFMGGMKQDEGVKPLSRKKKPLIAV